MPQIIKARQWAKERASAERDRAGGIRKMTNYFADALKAGELQPDEFNVREAFLGLVPNGREAFEYLDPADEWSFEAAVNTTLFSFITKSVLSQSVQNNFDHEDFILSRLIPTETERQEGAVIPGIRQIGDKAEIVAEGDFYPSVTFSEDWERMPIPFKKGMIIPITREAIFYDRTGLILRMAAMIGEWLGVHREKEIADTIIDNPRGSSTSGMGNRYDWRGTQYATYDTGTNWTNSQSNPLTNEVDVEDAEKLFDDMLDPYTGEPIVIGGNRTMLVMPDKRFTAAKVVNATEFRFGTDPLTIGPNPLQGMVTSVLSSRILYRRVVKGGNAGTAVSTSNAKQYWYYGDFSKAFAWVEHWPLVVEQIGSGSHWDFTQDIATAYKARYKGTARTKQPRYMVRNTN